MLQNGTVDIFGDGIWSLTEDRAAYFDWSFPLISNGWFHIMRKPDVSPFSGTTLIFNVFSRRFYAALALLISSALFLSRFRFIDNVNNLFFQLRNRALSVMVGYLLLVVVGLYQGKLLAELLFFTTPSPITGLDAMVSGLSEGRMTLLTGSLGWSYFEKINKSENSDFR